MMQRIGALLLALLLVCSFACCQDTFEGVQRIVAVGDVHGGFEELVRVLRSAGVIDGKNQWKAGETHLVQTGDLVDRGPRWRSVMELLMRLEKQATKAGGMVHVLLGNHETMNMYGDLRYASAGEFDSYRTPDFGAVRDRTYEELAGARPQDDPGYRRKWDAEQPSGWFELRAAFSPNGQYGKWLREKNTVITINNTLFLHGGISPKYLSMSIREINDRVRDELKNFAKLPGGMVTDLEGPLWYGGLGLGPEQALAEHVDNVLKAYGVQHIVVAHTPTMGAVVPLFRGKVFMIDVGLSRYYGGPPACLLIENNEPFAIHRGSKVKLPTGTDIRPYLKAIAALEPSGSRLRKLLDRAAVNPQ